MMSVHPYLLPLRQHNAMASQLPNNVIRDAICFVLPCVCASELEVLPSPTEARGQAAAEASPVMFSSSPCSRAPSLSAACTCWMPRRAWIRPRQGWPPGRGHGACISIRGEAFPGYREKGISRPVYRARARAPTQLACFGQDGHGSCPSWAVTSSVSCGGPRALADGRGAT